MTDVTYADLVARARAMIPGLDPAWTDQNPGDPGIALIEMLAWLTEMMVFQAGEIPGTHHAAFRALLNGPGPDPGTAGTVRGLRERYRAATAGDFEFLLTEVWPTTEEAETLAEEGVIGRILCVPGQDLSLHVANPSAVSVVLVPDPSDRLRTKVAEFLAPRRIITTRVRVLAPEYVPIQVQVVLASDAPGSALLAVQELLSGFLDPLTGGRDGGGRPFGQAVFTSELYRVLQELGGVDHVESVKVNGPSTIRDDEEQVIGVAVEPYQLVRLTAITLTAYDGAGQAHTLNWAAS